MAFNNNKTQLKKKNYNAFMFLDNKALLAVEGYSETILNALTNFPSNPKEASLGVNVMTNDYDVYVISSGSFTSTATDGKLKFGIVLSPKAVVAFINTANQSSLNGVFPLGTCLSEAEIKEEKGEDVQLLSGDKLVVDKNISFNIVMPRGDKTLRNFLVENNSFPYIGIMFKDLNSKGFAYINKVPLFAGVTIKSNALNQLTFSATYSVPATENVLLLGTD